jgi:hypothetical protein
MLRQATFPVLPNHLKWRCDTVDPGESVTGILAGPMQVIATHWNGKQSKPCCRVITGGALNCPCSFQPMSIRTYGYVPLLTEKMERVVVVVSATVGYTIRDVKPGRVLRFTRPKKAKRPLVVNLVNETEVNETWLKKVKPACIFDITEYLLHLWQIRELTEHFGFEYRPATSAGSE